MEVQTKIAVRSDRSQAEAIAGHRVDDDVIHMRPAGRAKRLLRRNREALTDEALDAAGRQSRLGQLDRPGGGHDVRTFPGVQDGRVAVYLDERLKQQAHAGGRGHSCRAKDYFASSARASCYAQICAAATGPVPARHAALLSAARRCSRLPATGSGISFAIECSMLIATVDLWTDARESRRCRVLSYDTGSELEMYAYGQRVMIQSLDSVEDAVIIGEEWRTAFLTAAPQAA